MERYLSFELSSDDAQQSDFAAYTLGTTKLLPSFFGDVAPINVFLGENNSGKSRFMRAIMKCNPTRIIEINPESVLVEVIENALSQIECTPTSELYGVEFTAHGNVYKSDNAIKFLSITKDELNKGSQINLSFEPRLMLGELSKILKATLADVSDTELLLHFIGSSYIEKITKEISEIIFNLLRVSNIYVELWNKQVHGFSPSLIQRGKLIYNSGYGNMVVHSYEAEKLANQYNYVEEFGKRASNTLKPVTNTAILVLNELQNIILGEPENRSRTYIPTLRTARTLSNPTGGNVREDIFESTISIDYELKEAGVNVNTGLSLYTAIDEKVNSEIDDREEFEKFEQFLSETFFNGKPVRVVPNRKRINILVAVNREERALPHLGDGIQAIILLLYPLFIALEGEFFFIEEPEMHLHPGFQRLFIKTVATHPVLLTKKLTIFLTTHSNHLLDFAIDEAKNINLFTFRKILGDAGNASYQVQLTAPHDLECLTALGVQNSSVFLSNCTIWIEGITDRVYLKAYLAAYLKHRKQTFSLLEGLHYSFLEYAGANVSHYTFGAKAQQVIITDEALKDIKALSISNRIMLIADQDAGKETKHQRLTSQQHAGFEYIVIPTREIENLLTPETIVGALKKLYPKQTEYFDADQLKQGQYKTIYLAKHLQGKFSELPDSFVGSSGTISSAKKRLFAEAAAEVITSWEMLSSEAQELTERVFKFIMGHNPRLGSN
jgi:predicted ATP-dependent endonuclease of OLD family